MGEDIFKSYIWEGINIKKYVNKQFKFLSAVYKVSFFSTTSPTLVLLITCLVDNSHSNRCEVVPHSGFDLHFPNSY